MTATPYPCLWFDHQAAAAARHYCSIFPGSRIIHETPLVVNFELNGTQFMGLNGGPVYKMSSAVSFHVYCGSDVEIDRIYQLLSKDAVINMPLGRYDWSPRYAWVIDSFGVNWQLDVAVIDSPQKIVPSLLFVNDKKTLLKEVLVHYSGIFPQAETLMEFPYMNTPGMPDGALLFSQFRLNGLIFNAMSSSMHHDFDFTAGTSFVVECENQQEIDFYWEKLGEGGIYSMCGWLEDKFGVWWQVIPSILSKLMSDPEKAPGVIASFGKTRKFNIEDLLKL